MSYNNYPEKPIRIFLSHPKGGSSNTTIESMEAGLVSKLGQAIEFEVASGGMAGSEAPTITAASPPDGYSLLMATIGNIALLQSVYPEYAIDPIRDLTPISRICTTPNVLIAHPSLNISSVEELVSLAKSKPGELRCSGINPLCIHQLEFNNLIKDTGIVLKDVTQYHMGANPSLEALDEGKVDLVFMTCPRAVVRIKEGLATGITVIGSNRISVLPDLPTAPEQGLPSLAFGSWSGLFAPGGTPSEIIDILFDAVKSSAEAAEVTEQASREGMVIDISESPTEFADFINSEALRLGSEARETGLGESVTS